MPSSGSRRTGALRGVTVAVGLIAGVRVSVGVGVGVLVGDRRGNRLLVRLAALGVTLPPIIALVVIHLPETGLDKSFMFALVFLFQGLHTTAN